MIAKVYSSSITRPANTTQYAIGDVLNANAATTPLAISCKHNVGEQAWLIGGRMFSSAKQSTLPQVDLLLFQSSFTIAADNAALDLSYAQIVTCLGRITFDSFTGYTTTSMSSGSVVKPVALTWDRTTTNNYKEQTIYAVPVLLNAYTPVSGEQFTFQLDIQFDHE